jgi:hypothetical protein
MLGFCIEPGDTGGLAQAVEMASCLWGGTFFPIIPLLKRIVGPLRREISRRISAEQMVAGYIDTFDPDVLVNVGNARISKEIAGNREIVAADDLFREFSDDYTPKWGIGPTELIAHFAATELKYVRESPLRIVFPVPERRYRTFLSTVFGVVPKELDAAVRGALPAAVPVQTPSCAIDNFVEFFGAEVFFLRRLMNLGLHPRRAESCLFFLDARSIEDIVSYWNLRAAGWNVLPLPLQACASAAMQSYAKRFIDANYWPYKHNPNLFHNTNVIKGRRVPPAELVRFINTLSLAPPEAAHSPRIVIVPHYPRIWDAWAREKDQVDVERIYSSEVDIDVSEDAKRIGFTPVRPEFVVPFGGHGTPRFVNDVDIRFYGGTDQYAEVIPSGGSTLARAIGAFSVEGWRFSRRGLSLLCEHLDLKVRFAPPRAELVFSEWLRTQGWEPQLSDKGYIATQMLKRLGGVRATSILASPGLLQLLRRMTARSACENVPGADADISSEPSGKVLKEKTFLTEIHKFASKEGFGQQVDTYVRRLLDLQMFRLGLQVQCRTCRQRWWQSLKQLDYRITCPNCFETFSVASWLPNDFEWAFRTIGPFSLPDSAFGVYAVLLTYRFFSVLIRGASTPLLSCNVRKGNVTSEFDLALLFELLQHGKHRRDIVFAECKSYNELDRKDVKRLEALGKQFPGAVLVFAILRDGLSSREQKLLRPFVNRSRRYWKGERPVHPVLILTANELFADAAPPRSWHKLGTKYGAFKNRYELGYNLADLADATQQIYLDLPPWQQWIHSKRRVAPLPVGAPAEVDESLIIRTPVHIALRQIEFGD